MWRRKTKRISSSSCWPSNSFIRIYYTLSSLSVHSGFASLEFAGIKQKSFTGVKDFCGTPDWKSSASWWTLPLIKGREQALAFLYSLHRTSGSNLARKRANFKNTLWVSLKSSGAPTRIRTWSISLGRSYFIHWTMGAPNQYTISFCESEREYTLRAQSCSQIALLRWTNEQSQAWLRQSHQMRE